MSYSIGQKGEIIIEGWEKGIATSPHKGIANIQAGNISTETGEVMVSFSRAMQSQPNTTASANIAAIDGSHFNNLLGLQKGIWIEITGTSDAGQLANDKYWAIIGTGGLQLSATYRGTPISGLTNVTATIKIFVSLPTYNSNITKPIAHATESYSDTNGVQQYRYFILDDQGLVWCHDTADDATLANVWFLADPRLKPGATGLAVLNGWVIIFTKTEVFAKPTCKLNKDGAIFSDDSWTAFTNLVMLNTNKIHFAFVGHQNILYYTDGNFVGSIFPDNAIVATATGPNIQSYCSYTTSTTTGTISALIGGSIPSATGAASGLPRIPAWFFASGTKPTAITLGTVYWIEYHANLGTFEVYAAATGGAAIDITTGASGTQYFNTFNPTSISGLTGITITHEHLSLPFFETAQTIGEVSNNVIIGCAGNVLYPWNQVDPKPSDIIPLPEINAVQMITVNNMLYVFAGNKGNIYVTNGSTASLVLTVPDYTAGIAGTPASYVEPYFIWGDAMYCRGRVYFSILDQTLVASSLATKAGNCGGVWSFVPTQNFYIGQDTGLSLRMDNQNSYGTYSGYATVLIPSQTQTARSPQYWSGWQSSLTSPLYGIDGTDITISTPCVVETDLIPTGTLLEKKTFSQIEYKLTTPINANESVAISYRQNSTDEWVSCGTAVVESATTALSGYFPIIFEKGQWLQLKVVLTPSGVGDFVRLKQIIIR